MIDEKSTTELENILRSLDEDSIPNYLKSELQGNEPDFETYIKNFLLKKDMKLKTLFERAGFENKLGYKLLSGERTLKRDWVIRLCAASGMNLKQVNRSLKLCHFSELYAKDPRDAVITIGLNRGVILANELDELLKKYNLQPLI